MTLMSAYIDILKKSTDPVLITEEFELAPCPIGPFGSPPDPLDSGSIRKMSYAFAAEEL